jgi:integrase
VGVYIRYRTTKRGTRLRDSPFYWMALERERKPPIRRSTRVLIDADTAGGRRDQRALADEIYRVSMGDLARGTFNLPTTRPRLRFKDHAAWYRDTITKQHRGVVRERSMVNALIRAFQQFWLDEIEESTIEDWKALRAGEVSKQTVNRELIILKPMLDKAVPKYLETNPARKVKPFRVPKFTPVTILNFSAEDAILDVATPEERAFILLGLDALMRLGDVRRFNLAHDHGSVLEVVDPKTGSPYKVPISSRLREALDAIKSQARARGGFYFGRKYRRRWAPISEGTAFKLFADLCTRAKVPRGRAIRGITYHGLRHTGTTRALKATKATAVMRLGGWSTLRQLVRYDHPDDPDLIRGVEAIGTRPQSRNVHAIDEATKKTAESGGG